MEQKTSSEIISLDLSNQATYTSTDAILKAPSFVNFIFGCNGSGKSTIANAIKNCDGISWRDDRTKADYDIEVFNQEFVNDNFQREGNNQLSGIFTVDKVNIEAKNAIAEKQTTLNAEQDKLSAAIKMRQEKETALAKLRRNIEENCWSTGKELREKYKNSLKGLLKKAAFCDAIIGTANAKEHNLHDLNLLYVAAYASTTKTYNKFTDIQKTDILDTISGQEILAQPIISSAGTPFAKLVKKLNALSWLKHGHDKFQEHSEDKCPYCQQKLPADFEDSFRSCFDEQYTEDTAKLNAFISAYKTSSSALLETIQQIPTELHPDVEIKPYRAKVSEIGTIIDNNLHRLADKATNSAISVTLDPLSEHLSELSNMIQSFNKLIDDTNAIYAHQGEKKKECHNHLLQHLAFMLKDKINEYNTAKSKLIKEQNEETKNIKTINTTIENLQQEISEWTKKTVNTAESIESINKMLSDTGFQGFSLRAKPSEPNTYEIIRDGGIPATHLSEGELHFIAFLYFYHCVHGSRTAEGDSRGKIIVIDDPVTSMDSMSIFQVSTLVEDMIKICLNNAYPNENGDSYIKQIFILTHNREFHYLITRKYENAFRTVNFYQVTKHNNQSRVSLSAHIDEYVPGRSHNINPVCDKYSDLWQAYWDATSAPVLTQAIHNLLVCYLIQIFKHEPNELNDILLKEHRNDFIITDSNGHEDKSCYHMVSALLSRIDTYEQGGILRYIGNDTNLEALRESCRRIFKAVGQEHLYETMRPAEIVH